MTTRTASQERDSASGTEAASPQPVWVAGRCPRSGGVPVAAAAAEELLGDAEILSAGEPMVSRCINCGNLVDPVILRNQEKATGR